MLWSKRIVTSTGEIQFITDTSKGLPLRSIHCFVFACPAIMSPDLSKAFRNLVTTFIYRHDVVPSLSLGLIRDFRNITVSFCHEEGLAESVIAKVLGVFKESGGGLGERDDLWYWALLKTLRADMKAEKLYPPGRVFWINAKDTTFDEDLKKEEVLATTPLSIFEVEDVAVAFGEVVFSSSMFTDHSPHHYEGCMAELEKVRM